MESALQTMKERLRPLGIYRLDGGTLVETELAAYAAALDALNEEIETLERESFVPTAQGYGLALREEMFTREKAERSAGDRRDMLLYRGAVTANDCTRAAIERAMVAAGIRACIVEQVPSGSLYINCIAMLDTFVDRDAAEKKAREFLPAHLNAVFDFRPLQWDYLDGLGLTFSEAENRNLTWDGIDGYGQQ